MQKSHFKLVYSNGSIENVHCFRSDLESFVLNRLDMSSTLDVRITYIKVYKIIKPSVGNTYYRFVSKYYVNGLHMCNAI